MREATKKSVKNTKIRMFMLIVSTVLALTAFLICQFAVGKDKLGFAPIFMLFIVFFMFVGVEYLVYSLIQKSTLTFSAGGLSFIAGLFILLLCLHILWWVVVIIALALCLIVFFSVFLFKAPDTTLEFDNGEDSGRKSYEERKAEEQASEQNKESNEDLPKIKSFKD